MKKIKKTMRERKRLIKMEKGTFRAGKMAKNLIATNRIPRYIG